MITRRPPTVLGTEASRKPPATVKGTEATGKPAVAALPSTGAGAGLAVLAVAGLTLVAAGGLTVGLRRRELRG